MSRTKVPLKNLNQFVEIFLSVVCLWIGGLVQRHWDSGAGNFGWWSGMVGLLAIELGGGGGVVVSAVGGGGHSD